MEQLAQWWEKKFNLPSNHELFLDRTIFDLLVDFHLDMFEKNPLDAHRNDDGHVQFTDTGDALLDKWEQQIADGEAPDLNEAFSPEAFKKLAELRQKAADKNPYASMTMKDVVDNVDRQAKREGFTSDARRREIAEHLKKSTFSRG